MEDDLISNLVVADADNSEVYIAFDPGSKGVWQGRNHLCDGVVFLSCRDLVELKELCAGILHAFWFISGLRRD